VENQRGCGKGASYEGERKGPSCNGARKQSQLENGHPADRREQQKWEYCGELVGNLRQPDTKMRGLEKGATGRWGKLPHRMSGGLSTRCGPVGAPNETKKEKIWEKSETEHREIQSGPDTMTALQREDQKN